MDMEDKPQTQRIRATSEISGACGDLGTLVPYAVGAMTVAGMSAFGVLLGFGAFLVAAGLYFAIPIAVQPMKAVGALIITGELGPAEVAVTGMMTGVILILGAATGLIGRLSRLIPRSVTAGTPTRPRRDDDRFWPRSRDADAAGRAGIAGSAAWPDGHAARACGADRRHGSRRSGLVGVFSCPRKFWRLDVPGRLGIGRRVACDARGRPPPVRPDAHQRHRRHRRGRTGSFPADLRPGHRIRSRLVDRNCKSRPRAARRAAHVPWGGRTAGTAPVRRPHSPRPDPAGLGTADPRPRFRGSDGCPADRDARRRAGCAPDRGRSGFSRCLRGCSMQGRIAARQSLSPLSRP